MRESGEGYENYHTGVCRASFSSKIGKSAIYAFISSPPLTSSNRHNPHPPQKSLLTLLPQRGGEGNAHREKGSQMHEGLADKLKHKMFGKKEEK